jgi:hypothetical protein
MQCSKQLYEAANLTAAIWRSVRWPIFEHAIRANMDLPSLDPAERQREGPGALVTPPAISKQVSSST